MRAIIRTWEWLVNDFERFFLGALIAPLILQPQTIPIL